MVFTPKHVPVSPSRSRVLTAGPRIPLQLCHGPLADDMLLFVCPGVTFASVILTFMENPFLSVPS